MPFVSNTAYGRDSTRLPIPLSTDATGKEDGFVYKYTSSGQALWSVRIASSNTSIGVTVYGTATDSTGALYVVGGASTDAYSASGILFYNANGSYAATVTVPRNASQPFLAKYTSSGVYQWAGYIATPAGTNGESPGYAVAVDPSNNVYLAGLIGSASTVVTAYNANGTAFGTTFTTPAGAAGDAVLVKYNGSGTVQWMTRISSSSDDFGRGLAADSSGVYMVGQMNTGTTTAYNANGTSFGTLTSSGSTDVIVAKYTLTGTCSWIARVATTAADVGYAAALDSAGSLYLTGAIGAATATAYSSSGSAFGTTLTSIGLGDAFLVKYNSTGTVQWVAKMGSTQTDIGYGVTTDSGNNVYVTGAQGAATFTAFSSTNVAFGTTLTSRGSGDAFLVKYNSTGTVQWVAQVGSTATEAGYAITSDTSDNVYLAVSASGSAPYSVTVYNSNASTFSSVSLTTNSATVLAKYNSSGTAQAAVGLNSSTTPYAISRDSSANLYLGGQTTAFITRALGPSASVALTLTNAGGTDAMIVKYTTNGVPWWAARIAGTGTDLAYAVATDVQGNIYVTGSVGAATATVYDSSGNAFATTITASRGFLVKYTLAGVVLWAASFTSNTGGRGIAVDSNGDVYVGGVGTASGGVVTAFNADGSTGVAQSTPVSSPGLLIKYNSSGVAQWMARVSTSTGLMGLAVAVDSSNNVVTCGSISNSGVVFNASGTTFATITTAGGADALAIKYNSSGTVQWVGRMGSATTDIAYGVACDSSGNVYVAGNGGSTTQAVTVYNGDGTTYSTLPVSAGSTDGYIVKYNSTGTVQWLARIASADADTPYALTTDSSGILYLVGYSGASGSTAVITFYNADGTTTVRGVEKAAITGFLVEYSSDGVVQAAIRLDGTGVSTGDYAYAVATDRRRNVYAGGLLNTAGATGVILDVTSNYSPTTALNAVKFTPYGVLQWHQALTGTTTYPITYGLATDFDCNLIVVGQSANGQTTNIYGKA